MVTELVSLALIYFAVIDPIGTIPIFLSITERFDYKQKQRVALRGCAIAFLVLVFFGFFGVFLVPAGFGGIAFRGRKLSPKSRWDQKTKKKQKKKKQRFFGFFFS